MRLARTIKLATCLTLLALALPGTALADHVSVSPAASALLGKRISNTSWQVKVTWAVNCNGAANPNYYGNLSLVDAASGEVYYLGGIAGAAGDETCSAAAAPT
jgi:hypothetical protein